MGGDGYGSSMEFLGYRIGGLDIPRHLKRRHVEGVNAWLEMRWLFGNVNVL